MRWAFHSGKGLKIWLNLLISCLTLYCALSFHLDSTRSPYFNPFLLCRFMLLWQYILLWNVFLTQLWHWVQHNLPKDSITSLLALALIVSPPLTYSTPTAFFPSNNTLVTMELSCALRLVRWREGCMYACDALHRRPSFIVNSYGPTPGWLW